MFNITKFIMDTLKGMKGNYPDFQIREYALNWYEKGKLTEDDLAELETYLTPIIDEITEETVEDNVAESENIEEIVTEE